METTHKVRKRWGIAVSAQCFCGTAGFLIRQKLSYTNKNVRAIIEP